MGQQFSVSKTELHDTGIWKPLICSKVGDESQEVGRRNAWCSAMKLAIKDDAYPGYLFF